MSSGPEFLVHTNELLSTMQALARNNSYSPKLMIYGRQVIVQNTTFGPQKD